MIYAFKITYKGLCDLKITLACTTLYKAVIRIWLTCTRSELPGSEEAGNEYKCSPMLHSLNSITLRVKVPVLSENMYFT